MKPLAELLPVPRVSLINVSPDEENPFYETEGSLLEDHFELNDLIQDYNKEDVSEDLEQLCLMQIGIAPELIASERQAAQMNGRDFCPVAHAGYNRLSAILFSRQCWEEVVQLYNEAKAGGWNVAEMEARVEAAKRALTA
ncbi:MAG: hypothetical protein ABIS50_07540 [Luteolibacter sp.]|uniref:hypothetical protein n=1 Tax=Luteolibacter sp. TaxID=1962973 RepID=UPI003267515D